MSVPYSHVPHEVYIFAYVDSSSESTVFFSSPLSVRLSEFCSTAHRHLCLHCSGKNFALYNFKF